MKDSNLELVILPDMDECATGSPCAEVDHTACQNTDGGFACVCVEGYTLSDMTGQCEGK